MVTASYLQLNDLAPQAFVNHVVKSFSLSSAVRAALFALPSEPLVGKCKWRRKEQCMVVTTVSLLEQCPIVSTAISVPKFSAILT
jgi:hypothetical protein